MADHRSGILFEPGHADALIREIGLWANHPEQLQVMGIHGRKLAQQRSWENIFDQLIEDYEKIIEQRNRRFKTTFSSA
nr:hypothetical protein [Paenibacillus xylanexedens]